MKFADKVAGSKVIVALGHTKCGVFKGACDHVERGSLAALLSKLQPAVYDQKTGIEDRHSDKDDFVEKVAVINVKRTLHAIIERSLILKEMIKSNALAIIGGIHGLTTGELSFYEDTRHLRLK